MYVGGDFTTIKNTARTRIAKLNTTNGNVVTAFDASSDKRITESALAPDGSRLLVGGENDVINGQPQAAIASLNPTTGALDAVGRDRRRTAPANGGCDTASPTSSSSGSIAYVTADGPSPGCWEGYYAANISDGSLIYNERCLGGSVGLAVVSGWMYRGSHNHDCAKNPGGYVGPDEPERLRLAPARGAPALGRSARPLEPEHRRRRARDLDDRRPAGHRDRRHQPLRRRRLQHGEPAEPAGPDPLHAERRQLGAR